MLSTFETSTAEAITRALLLVDERLVDDGYAWSDHQDLNHYNLTLRVRKLSGLDERSTERIVKRVHEQGDSLLRQVEWLSARMGQRRHGLLELRPDPLARQLARLVDPDALFILADGSDLDDGDTFDWAAVPALDGGPTRDLHREGSTETHIHLGGALPPLFYWLPLMGGGLDFTTAARAAVGHREGGRTELWARELARAAGLRTSLAAQLEEQLHSRGFGLLFARLPKKWYSEPIWKLEQWRGDGIRVSLELRRDLLRLTEAQRLPLEVVPDWPFPDPLRRASCLDPAAAAWQRVHYAQGERRWLYHLGHWLRQQLDATALGRKPPAEVMAIETALLHYLRLRNAFHRLLIHDRGSQGLLRFVENFSKRRLLSQHARGTPRGRWQARRRRRLRRTVVALERSRMEAALTAQLANSFDDTGPAEQRPRRRLEMRVAPPELPLLLPTVQAWLEGIRDHLRGPGAIRNSQVGLLFHLVKSPKSHEKADNGARSLEFLLRHYPDVRPFVVGLDAAGDERSAPPRAFTPAFQRIEKLRRQLRQQPHRQPLRLGFTYHVGEDVDDLLTGLRHIDEVVTLLLPEQTGGRLGHALALGFDPPWFYRRHGGETAPPLGTHLLDLVWAADRLRRQQGSAALLHHVEDRLHAWLPQLDPLRLEQVQRQMRLRVPEKKLLTEKELLGEKGLQVDLDLAQPVPVRPADLPWWLELVSWLQEQTRQHLARKRVCIEANPTSNLIIGDFDGYADLPYRRLVNDKLPVSLNTDDPGLFLTSLPGEFSAMYAALTGELTHSEALHWLRERRFDAEQSSFLGNHVPAGKGAVEAIDHALARRGLLRGGNPDPPPHR